MRNPLAMALFSRRSLTRAAAKQQITALSSFHGGLVRPDKCSEFEPIRSTFDPNDISKQIEWLAKPHGEFFYRKGTPVYASGEMWNLTHSPTARFPSPLFTNYWTGRFDGLWANHIGIQKIEDFVCEMFVVTHSDFALLTSEVDLKAKNRLPNSYSYQGLDLACGVPGLYWVNIFSEEFAAWLGLRELPKDLADKKILKERAVLVKFGDSPDDSRNFEVFQRQRLAIEWLGPHRFFDIRFPDRKLEAPNWDELLAPSNEALS